MSAVRTRAHPYASSIYMVHTFLAQTTREAVTCSKPSAVSGSGHIGTLIESLNSLKLSNMCKVRLRSGSQHGAAHPSCHSSNNSRRFALGASNVCLVRSKSDVLLRRGIVGMRGSIMAIRLRLRMISSAPPLMDTLPRRGCVVGGQMG